MNKLEMLEPCPVREADHTAVDESDERAYPFGRRRWGWKSEPPLVSENITAECEVCTITRHLDDDHRDHDRVNSFTRGFF